MTSPLLPCWGPEDKRGWVTQAAGDSQPQTEGGGLRQDTREDRDSTLLAATEDKGTEASAAEWGLEGQVGRGSQG